MSYSRLGWVDAKAHQLEMELYITWERHRNHLFHCSKDLYLWKVICVYLCDDPLEKGMVWEDDVDKRLEDATSISSSSPDEFRKLVHSLKISILVDKIWISKYSLEL